MCYLDVIVKGSINIPILCGEPRWQEMNCLCLATEFLSEPNLNWENISIPSSQSNSNSYYAGAGMRGVREKGGNGKLKVVVTSTTFIVLPTIPLPDTSPFFLIPTLTATWLTLLGAVHFRRAALPASCNGTHKIPTGGLLHTPMSVILQKRNTVPLS